MSEIEQNIYRPSNIITNTTTTDVFINSHYWHGIVFYIFAFVILLYGSMVIIKCIKKRNNVVKAVVCYISILLINGMFFYHGEKYIALYIYLNYFSLHILIKTLYVISNVVLTILLKKQLKNKEEAK